MNDRSSWILLKRFISEILVYKRMLLYTILAIIGTTITTLASPYLLGLAIDKYILPGRFNELPFIATLYLLTLIGQWIFITIRSYIIQVYGQKILFSMRNKLFDKLLRLKISFYKDKQVGDLVSRVINDTSTLNEVLVSGILSVIGDLFSLIGVLIVMFLLSPSLTLVSMITIPLMIVIAKYFGGKLRRAYKETREKIARISSIVGESLAGIEAIKAFGREDNVLKEFEQASRETVKTYIKVAVLMGFFWPLMQLSSILSIVVVIIYGGYLSLQGLISIGIVIAFIQYVQRFIQPINSLISMYDSLQSAFAALERIYEIIDVKEYEYNEGIEIKRFKGNIVFENVWFEYESGKPVLKNINIEIRSGELVAIIGHTGAGKTTLVNLLLRFYDPVKGRIFIDGIDIRNIKREALRNRISYVPQETYLFPGTIMDNIRIGKPGASEEEIIKICKELGIHEFIEKLPNGYYTDAGEAGKKLSVGEKQLIAIARAMLRDPDIVVLDEALSSVDPKTEEIIRKAIKKLMKGRTGIIIAHRLSIVKDVDKIIVLDNGEIVEAGAFNELLKKRRTFYKFYVSQISGYMEKEKIITRVME